MTATTPSADLAAKYASFVVPTYARSLAIARGRGTEVWDMDGRRYLDLGGGIAVNCLGHAHPAIASALAKQAAELIHTSNLYYTRPQAELAERLVELAGPGKIFFCNSGAEANETLYKLARRHGHDRGRFEILTALNSFHGRTLAGIAATGQDKVRKGFDPVTPGFRYIPFNDLAAAEQAVTATTAAILVEGIQGEGGVTPATPEYLLGLRALCDRHGILLMMDSVQCGMFRTGSFLSPQRILEDTPGGDLFRPDALSLAKALGGGFPIGAAWIAAPHADILDPGSHGTTFGGTPLACAVALAVLDTIESENLAHNARRMGELLRSHLEVLAAKYPSLVTGVRGYGCMLGAGLADRLPVGDAVAALRERGLLAVPAGLNTLRFLPPYNIAPAHCEEAAAILDAYLSAIPSP